MARLRRLQVLQTTLETGLVPVFSHPDAEVAMRVARAVHAGGCRLLEFTHRGDYAVRVFEALVSFAARELPDLIVGVGSIGDAPTAALYAALGAEFVVGPVLNPEVARLLNRKKIAYMPGCGSASEVAAAEELGCEIVKVFPGDSVGGPAFVRSILGPCPWSLLMPTGGVEASRESVDAWIKAGTAVLGIGSSLITRAVVERGEYDALTGRVKELLEWIRQARSPRGSTS